MIYGERTVPDWDELRNNVTMHNTNETDKHQAVALESINGTTPSLTLIITGGWMLVWKGCNNTSNYWCIAMLMLR